MTRCVQLLAMQSVWQSQPWRPVTLPSTRYTHPGTSASSRSPAAEAAASRPQLLLPISAEQLLEHAMDAAAYGQGIGDTEQRTKSEYVDVACFAYGIRAIAV